MSPSREKKWGEKTVLRKTSCFLNKLYPQTHSTGSSDNWANQQFSSVNLPTKTTLIFRILLIVERWFFCSLVQVLEAGLAKWRRQTRIWTLENKLKQLGKKKTTYRKKRGGVTVCQWVRQYIGIRLIRRVNIAVISWSSSQIFTEPMSSLDSQSIFPHLI